MSAAGFTSPSILFLSTWAADERDFVYNLSRRLLAKGFTRAIDPSCGAMAASIIHRAAGWEAEQIEASDVWLYSAIVGYAASGKDLADLNVKVDDEVVPLAGDSITDAAILLHKQLEMRLRTRPDSYHWRGILNDVVRNQDRHIKSLKEQVGRGIERLEGFTYEAVDIWTHLDRIKDDPRTVVVANPPTYRSAYEKHFNTNDRLTWSGPSYAIWDPERDQPKLAEVSRDWPALVVVQQQAEPGKAAGEVVFARHLSRHQYVYLWTNQPDRVNEVLGRSAVPRGGDLPKPDYAVIPYDHEITKNSTVSVEKIPTQEIAYYKTLWLHKLDPRPALWNVAVFIDGYLAGIAGVSNPPPQTAHNQQGNLLLVFATGAPHKDRLTRLVTMLVLSRPVLRKHVEAFSMAQVEQLITAELTKHPEIKGLRGLMKLESRKPDSKHGWRLIYTAPLTGDTPEEIRDKWIAKERQWHKSRNQQAKAGKA